MALHPQLATMFREYQPAIDVFMRALEEPRAESRPRG
jgi:hypothetical protein